LAGKWVEVLPRPSGEGVVVRPLAEPTGARHSRAQEGVFQRWMHEQTWIACVTTGGAHIEGRLSGYDSYAILLTDGDGQERLIFKHALVEMRPAPRP